MIDLTGQPIIFDGGVPDKFNLDTFSPYLENRDMEDFNFKIYSNSDLAFYITHIPFTANGFLQDDLLLSKVYEYKEIVIHTKEGFQISISSVEDKQYIKRATLEYCSNRLIKDFFSLLVDRESYDLAEKDATWFHTVLSELKIDSIINGTQVRILFKEDNVLNVYNRLKRDGKILTLIGPKVENTLIVDFIYSRREDNFVDAGKLSYLIATLMRNIDISETSPLFNIT